MASNAPIFYIEIYDSFNMCKNSDNVFHSFLFFVKAPFVSFCFLETKIDTKMLKA